MKSRQRAKHQNKILYAKAPYLLAGGSMLTALALVVDVGSMFKSKPINNTCQEITQPKATLSRDQLARLLTIPERTDQARVRAVVNQPYCKLPDLQVREGVTATREAYPLAFDTETKVVILYEGNEYAGYAFAFNR